MSMRTQFILLLVAHLCARAHSALTMNCTAAGVKGTDCQTHMRLALADFIYEQRSYSVRNIPVADPSESIDVGAFLTFFHLTEVNQVEGRLTMSIYIDLFWKDYYIHWDPKWCDGIEALFVDPELLWKPDIQLYNTIGVYEETMDQTSNLWIEYDNDVWWSRPGAIASACVFDLKSFPFDSQTCNLTFGSFMYDELMLNFSLYNYEGMGDTVVRPGFQSLTWEIDSVSAHHVREVIYGYDFTLLTWQIDMSRYYGYYISNAILPSLCVTLISLGALWIPDVQNRLALAVTALLTIVAVQWTVSATLPVTESTTWLAEFSNVCILYVALICGECCVVAYMGGKKGKPNRWVKALIILSNVVKVGRKYVMTTVESYFYWKRKRSRTSSADVVKSPIVTDSHNIEMARMAALDRSRSATMTSDASRRNGRSGEMDSDDEDDMDADTTVAGMGVPSLRRPNQVYASKTLQEEVSKFEHMSDIERMSLSEPPEEAPKEPKYSWERGARAIDRLTRVVLPVSFIVIVLMSYYY